jgi:hypothetical protein
MPVTSLSVVPKPSAKNGRKCRFHRSGSNIKFSGASDSSLVESPFL